MGLYARHILPRVIDLACRHRDIFRARQELVPQARGRVLEVGFGTGLNLSSYAADRVERLWALEPYWESMQAVAGKRMRDTTLEVEVVAAGAAAIPMPTDFFDSVVMTFTLCSIHEGEQALEEIRRVMKPGAVMLFAEHGLAPERIVQYQQRVLNPLWGACGGGCQLDRPMDRMITGAGFEVPEMQAGYLTGFRFASYVYSGKAYKR
ncbi:MAG: class I SAM-dependent methyltransferase [Gammaproteobacteria bacterium]|nr:class I SAM-dependent methyltransferase [Gammaproteobacteria bacterium]